MEEGKEEHLHHPFRAYPSCHLAAIVKTFEESCDVVAAAAAAATFLLTVAWYHVDSYVELVEKNHHYLQMVDRWPHVSVFLSSLAHYFADFYRQEETAVLHVAWGSADLRLVA